MELKINDRVFKVKSCIRCPFFSYDLDPYGYAVYVCKLNTFLKMTTSKGRIMTKLLGKFIWEGCPLKNGDLQN